MVNYSRSVIIGVLSALVLVVPSTSEAQWRWLDKLSGPGPFWGITGEFKLWCGYAGQGGKPHRSKSTGLGFGVSVPCLKVSGGEPDATTRKWAVGIATGLSFSKRNGLEYSADVDDGERRVLTIPIELYADRKVGDLEVGTFVGVHLFRGRYFADTAVPNFWQEVLGVRGGVALRRWGKDKKWGSLKLRGALTLYPKGFNVADFGAVGNWPERDRPDIGAEVVPSVSLVLDVDRWWAKR